MTEGTRSVGKAIVLAAVLLFRASPAWAMHIAEGILPASWAGLWFAVAAPFLWLGLREVRRRSGAAPHFKVLTGLVGAAVFVISCMPVPVPFTGTCSHPCGTGLAAVIVGPAVTTVIAAIVLLLQALFLAHGGLTTLGANIVSMGVVGAYAGWLAYAGMRGVGFGAVAAAGAAGLVSDWATYAATSGELAAALHGSTSFAAMFSAIALAFLPTQLPLGVLEAIVSGAALKFLHGAPPGVSRPAPRRRRGVVKARHGRPRADAAGLSDGGPTTGKGDSRLGGRRQDGRGEIRAGGRTSSPRAADQYRPRRPAALRLPRGRGSGGVRRRLLLSRPVSAARGEKGVTSV